MNDSYLIWGIALLVAALVMVMVEAFVPSAGVIALVAAALAIGGIVCLFKVSIVWGIIGILAFLGLGGAGFLYALSMMPNTRFGRRLVHGDDAKLDVDGEPDAPPQADNASLLLLIGKHGVAMTDLRPVGAVKIDEMRHQVISEISYVRAGTPVRVTAVEGTQIKVRPTT